MNTKQQQIQAYNDLPSEVKQVILALSILTERISSLPKVDRDELFELLQEWRKADGQEDQKSIHRAMEEILAQNPVSAKPMHLGEEKPMSRGLKSWSKHVGQKIKQLRESAQLTQVQLAEKAGLPQSHVSRLENAEHSATHLTLEKIAKALGVHVGEIDPCAD